MRNMNNIEKSANVALELSKVTPDLTDYREFPIVLHEVINKYYIFGSLALFINPYPDYPNNRPNYNIITHNFIKDNWDELYKEIEEYDPFWDYSLKVKPGEVYEHAGNWVLNLKVYFEGARKIQLAGGSARDKEVVSIVWPG